MNYTRAVLALGSNLGARSDTLSAAVADIVDPPEVRLLAISPIVQTKAVGGPAGQPDFLNMVIAVETTLTPLELLRHCHAVEQKHLRVRDVHWGPRTLDVDIITYGELVSSDPELTLPHPRAAAAGVRAVPVVAHRPGGRAERRTRGRAGRQGRRLRRPRALRRLRKPPRRGRSGGVMKLTNPLLLLVIGVGRWGPRLARRRADHPLRPGHPRAAAQRADHDGCDRGAHPRAGHPGAAAGGTATRRKCSTPSWPPGPWSSPRPAPTPAACCWAGTPGSSLTSCGSGTCAATRPSPGRPWPWPAAAW